MKRWSPHAAMAPARANSTVYCTNAEPPAGDVWTMAVAFRMPGSGARTKVSGVASR